MRVFFFVLFCFVVFFFLENRTTDDIFSVQMQMSQDSIFKEYGYLCASLAVSSATSRQVETNELTCNCYRSNLKKCDKYDTNFTPWSSVWSTVSTNIAIETVNKIGNKGTGTPHGKQHNGQCPVNEYWTGAREGDSSLHKVYWSIPM